MSKQASEWTLATLYGVDHSPWVQGIRFALQRHNIPMRLTAYPFGWRWFISRGLIFPALKIDNAEPMLDSFHMYGHLESNGFDLGLAQFSKSEQEMAQLKLEKLFASYALCRVGPGKKWAFLIAWSRMRERPFRVRGVFSRAIVSLYFWILIQIGLRQKIKSGRPLYELEKIEHRLEEWDARLKDKQWLTGDDIGFLDFALLGHIQCMTTGLTDEVLPILKKQAHLMVWLKRVLAEPWIRPPLYVNRLVNEEAVIDEANRFERLLFWLFLAFWVLFLPVTLVFLAVAIFKRVKNPAHTGAVVKRNYRKSKGSD